jgi:hypothetical protein
VKVKTALPFFAAVFLVVFAGCEPGAGGKKMLTGGKKLITVDFQEGQTLRYKFVSSRDIEVNWDPTKSDSQRGRNKIDKSSESMDMIVAYTPIEVNPYGLTTIKATCESAKIRRTQGAGKDAVESLPGASFTFTVEPTGKI